MPCYFFDVHDGESARDDEGVVLPNPEAARQEAILAAGSMLRDHTTLVGGDVWRMVVRDESGGVISTLTFTAS